MARTVDQFAPRRIRLAVQEMLAAITHANGYQTQPVVTDDVRVARDGAAGGISHVILVSGGNMITEASGSPMRWKVAHAITIEGQSMAGEGSPQDASEALMQDVLCALTGATELALLATRLGKGIEIGIGSVEHADPWATLEDGFLLWAITLTVGFQQTPPW
jgi:hypothetical protein